MAAELVWQGMGVMLALIIAILGGWAYIEKRISHVVDVCDAKLGRVDDRCRQAETKIDGHKLYAANNFVSQENLEKTENRLVGAIRELTNEVKSLRNSWSNPPARSKPS